ncbi:MAG: carbamoyl phosphate synthase small subunit [Lactobacillus sp.]|jgi:carbamoyl-phosphate synthase small subunit|nr:carbamoyl phosphate synthase small subunit [Lactobacillus sp.]MCH3906296.1 carbamoyl phosphate synthase small subunit [Lactobacillus sp.]MCH3990129.1 carbamoyl phosphate synthase small subunit [Lactobacillus sp.]MCH4069157.1 carbamoyl phosphate synthase small subunit [Lactobacillus sp.]MCI1303856.1 carbamoyl phosphate synthase small subunit [Lactobacillus sp.]
MKRYLILADGTAFAGEGFGASIIATGELALFTGNYGYQEALTDPANDGKILLFSTPLIGASGINAIDYEAINPRIKGIIAGGIAPAQQPATENLNEFLQEKGIPGIFGVDTHALVRKLVTEPVIKASIMDTDDQHAFDQIKALVLPKNKTAQTSTTNAYAVPNIGETVAVIDLGLKNSLLRSLSLRQINVVVMPVTASAEDIANLQPNGLIVSNGPGTVKEVRAGLAPIFKRFLTKMPVLGIGLGFLALSDYLNFELADLQPAYNGSNYPVIAQNTGRVWQTAMNISQLALPQTIEYDFSEKYYDLHSDLLAGYSFEQEQILATAFNPEGSPGAFEASVIFDDFFKLMNKNAIKN